MKTTTSRSFRLHRSLLTVAALAAFATLVPLAREHGPLSAANDRADVPALAGVDVFHTGQTDLTTAQCRALLGPDAGLIGAADLARQSIEDPPGLSGFWPRRRWRSRRLLVVPGEAEGRLTAGRRRNPRGRGAGGAG